MIELETLPHDVEPLMVTKHSPSADTSKYGVSQPHIQEKRKMSTSITGRLPGWRRALLLGSLVTILVLCFNLGFILWAVQHHHLQNSQGALYEGDCKTVRNASIGFHLVINILGTALLGASNYCMCLSAPTREDVDHAHQKGRWLDIGVPSLRNLLHVSRKRSRLWICLALSSVPLHLMYNSTIFSTISANAYNVFAGSGVLNQTALTTINTALTDDGTRQSFLRLHEKARNGTLYRLDNPTCVDAYATAYQSTYGSLVVATDDVDPASHYIVVGEQAVFNPTHEATVGASAYEWICQDLEHHTYLNPLTPCITTLPEVRSHIANNNWTVGGYRVNYCLAETIPPHCKLQYSLPLAVVVIIFNLVKAIVICYVALTSTDTPILTAGDAVASFIRTPDQFSSGMCLLSMGDVQRPKDGYRMVEAFHKTPKRWRSAIPRARWIFGIGFYSTAIICCLIVLALGLVLPFDSTGVWGVGLGQVSTQSLISAGLPSSVVFNTILANLPQLIFSMLYFASNTLLTTMTLAHEWSRYAIQPKGLRVSSHPMGSQRSTYFLSLPYRYAIPLLILSTLLHWLISESLFLVQVEAYSTDLERDPENDITTCGYSPVAIVSTISVAFAMFCVLMGLSRRRFKSGIPVAGSCSLAIAAACHPNPDPLETSEFQEDIEGLPLQWGSMQVDGEIGHCAFSWKDVDPPEEARLYQ